MFNAEYSHMGIRYQIRRSLAIDKQLSEKVPVPLRRDHYSCAGLIEPTLDACGGLIEG